MHKIAKVRFTKMDIVETIFYTYADKIDKGELKPGERLPGVHRAAREFGTSDEKVREAYNALQSAGIVERRDYMGTFVSGEVEEKPKAHLMTVVNLDGEMVPADVKRVKLDELHILVVVTPKVAA